MNYTHLQPHCAESLGVYHKNSLVSKLDLNLKVSFIYCALCGQRFSRLWAIFCRVHVGECGR